MFIELTGFHSKKKVLINLERVESIRPGVEIWSVETSQKEKVSGSTLVFSGEDARFETIETYEEVRVLVKPAFLIAKKDETPNG